MKDVRGKVFLVTGGAMGMGRLVAERFARDGAKVVIWDFNAEALEKTAGEFRDRGYEIYTDVVDVSDRELVYEAADKVKSEVGPVDILMNNAGIVRAAAFLQSDDNDNFNTLNINFISQMWTCKAFLPDMAARNAGHVIALASAAAITPTPYSADYAASKAAVKHFQDTLRWEMRIIGKPGIKFTTVCPSFVNTGMFAGGKPPILSPWVKPEVMADKIYQGYLKDTLTIYEPFIVKLTPVMNSLLTDGIKFLMARILRLNTALRDWKGH
jgi:all-trans-retinol dehydrogenase (NAD+)